jgi:thiosulfate/3-mercaptopyruvate sulfurtransferase
MKLLLTFTVLALSALNGAPACGGHGDRSTMLVSTEWLAGHLNDPQMVILAVGQKSDYDAAHLPGAQFLDYDSIHLMSSPGQPNNLELPPMPELVRAFGALGVANDSRIVLYVSKDMLSPTTRVYLTLDAMGLGRQTSILDGGLPVWKKEGRPVTTEVRQPKPGKLEACAQSDVIVDAEYVKSNLRHAGIAIVDARNPEFYTGERPGNRQRPGHIPGATNITYSTLVDEQGKFKPAAALQQQFRDAGVKSGDRVVSYCHIGQQATVVYFVARYLGFDARLYDGSFEDWSRRTDLPVEMSKK